MASSGELINGRYRLVRCLGEGGMGTVFLAADLAEDQRPVALKKVHAAVLTPASIEALKGEFALMTRLHHPNVVEVYDLGQDGRTGDPFLTLEYVEGSDLRQASAALPLEGQIELLVQVCRGLSYIHARDLIHNDLKPQNILVTASTPNTCKLMDFGLALNASGSSRSAGLRGTLQYLAPELVSGAVADRRSDLYALGVLFYLVLTGRLPFDGTVSEILSQITSGRPAPPRELRPELPVGLEALVMSMLARDPLARPDSASSIIASINETLGMQHPPETSATIASSARSARFVGRSREMERIARHVEACAAGEEGRGGHLVMVAGETGIGKSRLLRQVRYEAQMRGVRVLTGHCYEGTASAFHPFLQILRQIAPPGEAAGVSDVDALLGGAAEARGDAADPERERRRLSDAAVERLVEASQAGPLLIGIEDLQWADTATLSLLEHLARNVARLPRLLVMVSYRTEEADSQPLAAALPRLTRAGTWERLELGRLRVEDVAEMMQGLFGLGAPPPSVAARVAEETEGNPFFVQMALEGLLEDHPTLEGLDQLESIRFPRSLSEAITRRLERLDPEERQVMEALAVAESPVMPELLTWVARADAGVAAGAVERLRRRRLVREELDASGTRRIRLDHVKVRDHVYEAMDWQERRDLHGRIGRALEQGPGAPLEEIAHHFTHSADEARALDYAERAGIRALGLMATGQAITFLERAVELVPPREPERRLRLQLHLADAHRQNRDHVRAMETYDKVIRGARSAGLRAMASTASLHLIDLQARSGQHEEAQRAAERLLPVLEAEDQKALLATCHSTLAFIAATQGHLDLARERNERALALRREVQDIAGMASSLNNLGTLDALQGRTDSGLARLEESLVLHREAGDAQRGIETIMNIAHWHRLRGDMAHAITRFEEASGMARTARDRWLLCLAETSLAGLYHLQGRLDDALMIARRAVTDAQAVGHEERACEALDVMGTIQRDLGDATGALAAHEQATVLARRAGFPAQELYATASAALDKLASAPQEADLRSVRDALRKAARAAADLPSDTLRARLHEATARCHLASGEPGPALARARAALEAATASRVPAAMAAAELLVATCLLVPGLPERNSSEAAAAARRAADIASEAGLPDPQWQAHALLAAMHREEGHRIPEREELLRAARILTDVGTRIQDPRTRIAWLAETRRADVLRHAGPLAPSPARATAGGREEATPERALSAMYELSGILSSLSDLDATLERLLDVGLAIVSAERGLIILLDESGEQEVAAARELEAETMDDAREYSRNVVKEAAAGQVVVALDAGHDDRFRKFKSVNLYAIKSLMCVPMRVRDKILGTVYVDSRRQGIPFTEQDLRFLEAFANLAAAAVEQARLHERLATENVYLKREAGERNRFQNIIGRNVKMQAVYDLMEKVAASNLPVLVQGESGTGKELVARALHYSGPRRHRKFYSENVAAIPDTLLESEMFGHVRGAFTGADRDRKGLFELADGGTLFLDEIGDMSLPLQAKLLRALQDGEIRPVGGKESRHVDVRIISATNKDLDQMMREKRFREDLYYRLNVVRVALPPLRERKEDVPLLVDHFLQKAGRDSGTPPRRIDMSTMQLLLRYSWPGNIRELENEIMRLAVLCQSDVITQRDLMENAELYEKITNLEDQPGFTPLEELERRQIEKALAEAAGNRGRAAEMLGISRATIFRKLRKFNITH